MKFFPTQNQLQEAGAINKNGRQYSKETMQKAVEGFNIKERYGVGLVSKKGIAQADDLFSSGRCETFDRDNGDLHTSQHIFQLIGDADRLQEETLSVYLNGGEALEYGRDFTYDRKENQLRLTRPIREKDDDIEVRYRYGSIKELEKVLLLPRMDLTDAQLEALIPEPGDLFDVAKLMRHGNHELAPYSTYKAKSIQTWIDQYGIRGTLVLVK